MARLDNNIREDWCSGSLENTIGYQQVARRLWEDSPRMVYYNLNKLYTFALSPELLACMGKDVKCPARVEGRV